MDLRRRLFTTGTRISLANHWSARDGKPTLPTSRTRCLKANVCAKSTSARGTEPSLRCCGQLFEVAGRIRRPKISCPVVPLTGLSDIRDQTKRSPLSQERRIERHAE